MISYCKECTGCGACVQICPQKCIRLKPDKYGFNYPDIEKSDCLNCNLCEKVCPINKVNINEFKQTAYAAINNEDEELLKSTSGGVFGAIAKYVLLKDGTVYGCAWQKKLQSEHIRITNIKELYKLNGSKYVQSTTQNTFNEVKNDLENNKWVLYSGTPCQIDGLKSFLNKDYEKLITVDIICHGVPSQILFDKYINGLEYFTNTNIKNIEFRSKKNKKWGLSGTYSGTYRNSNNSFIKKFNYFESYYYYYFLQGYIYRESCYTCKYANLNRQGDFTLGDFWGCEALKLPFSTDNGCSLVIVNSEKGEKIIGSLNLNKKKVSLKLATKYNKQLTEPTKIYKDRNVLLDLLINNSFENNNNFFKEKFKMEIFISCLKYVVPKKLKKLLNIIRYHFL